MPQEANVQTQMNTFLGKAPALDDKNQIDDIAFKLQVTAKVADYTITPEESGTLFTNEGATGSVNFTLPAASSGLVYWFADVEDYEFKVSAASAILVAFDNVAATSVAYTTANEEIGGGFMVVSDGAKWFALGLLGADSQTITIA